MECDCLFSEGFSITEDTVYFHVIYDLDTHWTSILYTSLAHFNQIRNEFAIY